MMLIDLTKLTSSAFWLIFLALISKVQSKGTGVISASAGGNDVCVDCASTYTDDELKVALIVLCTILSVFLLILCCQCASRIVNECERQKRLRSKNPEMLHQNGYSRRIHSCDHSFYGNSSTRSTTLGQSISNFNNKNRSINYSLSQLDKYKNAELAKHCSVAAIACGPAQCAKAITSPEFKRKSPLDHHHDFHLDHHLPQSYHHLNNLDQSIDDLCKYSFNSNLEAGKMKNKVSLKRSATLAECNWPIDDHLNIDNIQNHSNLISHLHSDINHNYQSSNLQNFKDAQQKIQQNVNKMTKKPFNSNNKNYNKLNQTSSASTGKLNTGKLNASSLATVIAAHNKFIKLKNFARANTNQSFKSLPAPRYIRSTNVNVN